MLEKSRPGFSRIHDNHNNLLDVTRTDQNGVYLFVYKWNGPKVTFTIVAITPHRVPVPACDYAIQQTIPSKLPVLVPNPILPFSSFSYWRLRLS